jgi:hypothetical protein
MENDETLYLRAITIFGPGSLLTYKARPLTQSSERQSKRMCYSSDGKGVKGCNIWQTLRSVKSSRKQGIQCAVQQSQSRLEESHAESAKADTAPI